MGGSLMILQVPSILTPVVFTGATEKIEDMFLTFKSYFESIRAFTTPGADESDYIDMICEVRKSCPALVRK